MITREAVSAQLLAYLNENISLDGLIAWAENSLVEGGFGPEEDIDMLIGVGKVPGIYAAAGFAREGCACRTVMKRRASRNRSAKWRE